ncbi:hypothetical protein G3I74_05990 [Wenzhouxiangella sp. C33]|uniref:DUF6311 domain-containing protein n=2 Tax=Wenzhouxiangella limi TaxID=2707351 RepID=A0A845V1Y6_9GAMM|nr:hypothetical protein [Wenzhouxiangella limi]
MSLGLMLPALGAIECFAQTGAWFYCPLTSLGEQHALTYGLPMVQVAGLIRRLAPVDLLTAWNLASLLVLYVAGLGSQGFLRAIGVNVWLAVAGSILFLALPIVFAKSGYPLMLWGFALLPAVLWAQLVAWRLHNHVFAFALLAVVFSLALFQEPYSLVMALTFGGWLAIAQLLTAARASWPSKVLRVLVWLAAALLAVFLYRQYIPGGADYAVMPMDYFRGQGIDLLAFLSRNPALYALGPLWGVGALEPALFYTDGEMTAHSYLGLGLAMGLLGFVILVRPWRNTLHMVLLVSVVAAFLMALGPSLKIASVAEDRVADAPVTFDTYRMPAEAAVVGLPHAFVYEIAPFSNMRSVSRWYLLVAIGLVAMLMLFFQELTGRGRPGNAVAITLLLWVAAEYFPDFSHRLALSEGFSNAFRQLDSAAIEELSTLVSPGERVVFVAGDRYGNEFFSTYLCARAGCRTFNVSGDKPRRLAVASWPEALRERLTQSASAAQRAQLLNEVDFDVLVVPHFHMRWDSYTWPPADERRAELRAVAESYHALEGFEVVSGNWFTTVRTMSAERHSDKQQPWQAK